jgi:predicted nucleic acid-binding protein
VVRLASRCVTTEAVVTEACYMVARGGARAALVIEFLLEAQIPVLELDGEMLRHAAQLMDRYANIPMDYADAALVTIADGLDLTTARTIDRHELKALTESGTVGPEAARCLVAPHGAPHGAPLF